MKHSLRSDNEKMKNESLSVCNTTLSALYYHREVKISLKTGNLTSDLLDVILKVTDYSRRVIAETLQNYNKGGANDMNIVSEIRSRIVQYINTSLIEQDIYTCEYGATCNASKAGQRCNLSNG